ncbi:MAG: FkbM family methyltransferase, partial [Gammaproteobacteria bacterium]|nr:FkbM family methyltransferase [Gammaproteobacteria bacterium]
MNNFLKLTRILRVLQYGTALLRYRLPAGIEHEPVLRLRKYKTIVDVGANRGQFTLVARHCCPCARIIAFEPLRRPAERFRAIYKNDNGIALHQVAIGAATRVVRMNVCAP